MRGWQWEPWQWKVLVGRGGMRGCRGGGFVGCGGESGCGGYARGWVGCESLENGLQLLTGHVGRPGDLTCVEVFYAEEGVGRKRHIGKEGIQGSVV